MWVSTSFSSALNFLPHQVRSAFQLSICPPSIRMKRKFPCWAQGGTSSSLARYSLGAGSKDWAEQSKREATSQPISPIFFAIETGFAVSCLPGFKLFLIILVIELFFPSGGRVGTKAFLHCAESADGKTWERSPPRCRESATKMDWGLRKIDQLERLRNSSKPIETSAYPSLLICPTKTPGPDRGQRGGPCWCRSS